MRRRAIRWIVGALAAVSATAVAVACGLDEGETVKILDGGLDATGNDVLTDDGGTIPDVVIDVPDVFVPPTCATIDASCLGAAVPNGWALLGVASGTQACPSADFDPVALVENPSLTAGSCTCAACAAQGTYTCPGATMKFGSGCGSNAITVLTSSPCLNHSESGSNARLSAAPSNPVPTGVKCTIAATGSGTAATDPVSGCRPNKCTSDFCGLSGQGFKTCIVQDNVQACPIGFTLRGYVGGSASANCAACACTTPDARCTGNVRVFDNTFNCNGNGAASGANYKGTVPADGGCYDPSSNFNSVFYVPDPAPTPTCTPAAPSAGAGDAGLLAVKTICCAP
jgi:hypothetical protein